MLVNQKSSTYQRVPIFVLGVQMLCRFVEYGFRVAYCRLDSNHTFFTGGSSPSVSVPDNLGEAMLRNIRQRLHSDNNSDEIILQQTHRILGPAVRQMLAVQAPIVKAYQQKPSTHYYSYINYTKSDQIPFAYPLEVIGYTFGCAKH